MIYRHYRRIIEMSVKDPIEDEKERLIKQYK